MKYAIVLKIINLFGHDSIANTELPYLVPEGQENHAHYILEGQKGRLVIVADKETLMNNPFDLYSEDDFKKARELPKEKVRPVKFVPRKKDDGTEFTESEIKAIHDFIEPVHEKVVTELRAELRAENKKPSYFEQSTGADKVPHINDENKQSMFVMQRNHYLLAIANYLVGIPFTELTKSEKNIYFILKNEKYLKVNSDDEVCLHELVI